MAQRSEATSSTSLIVAPSGGLTGFSQRLADASARRTPLLPGPAAQHSIRFRYMVPEGWGLTDMPESTSERGRFGAYELRWTARPLEVEVQASLTLKSDPIAPQDYPAFRAFLQRLEQATSLGISWTRTSGEAP